MVNICDDIPNEVISHVLSFAGARDLAILSATCHLFRELASQTHLWRSLCIIQWPEQFDSSEQLNRICSEHAIKDKSFWKKYYIQKYLLDQQSDTLSWTQISLSQASSGGCKPSPRYAHSGTVVGDKIMYIGGQMAQNIRYNDFFCYDTSSGKFTQPKVQGGPPNISKHTTECVNGIFYIFGGYDGVSQRFSLFTYSPETQQWTSPTTYGTPPPPRSNHCSAVIGTRMYIFGGLQRVDAQLIDTNDLYYLDTTTMTWHTPDATGDIPSPRCGHKMTTVGNKIYLFGGGNGDDWLNKFNDLHLFDPATDKWSKMATTGCMVDSTTFSCLWNVGRFLFVFGGGKISDRGMVNDAVYAFDTVTRHWTQQKLSGDGPSPRDDCTTNVVGDVIYFMNGFNAGPINEFWSIQMSPHLYRSVHETEPPRRVIAPSQSPLMSLSPSLKRLAKLMNPFHRGRENAH